MWSPITYQARRCPTATGWIEHLAASDTVSDYQWNGREGMQAGTRVEYRIKTEVNSRPGFMGTTGNQTVCRKNAEEPVFEIGSEKEKSRLYRSRGLESFALVCRTTALKWGR